MIQAGSLSAITARDFLVGHVNSPHCGKSQQLPYLPLTEAHPSPACTHQWASLGPCRESLGGALWAHPSSHQNRDLYLHGITLAVP